MANPIIIVIMTIATPLQQKITCTNNPFKAIRKLWKCGIKLTKIPERNSLELIMFLLEEHLLILRMR